MKKKLLFVIPSLHCGGGEKSLINLLSLIDFSKYEVDLFLFKSEGLLLSLLPKEINLLPLPKDYCTFSSGMFKAILKFILKGKVSLAINRLLYSIKMRKYDNLTKAEQFTWKHIVRVLPVLSKEYDTAIGYMEKSSIYFVVDRVKALKKIGWIHTDYEKLQADPAFDARYFKKLNNIVTVSSECKEKLTKYFNSFKGKILVMNNIISEKTIKKLSKNTEEYTFLNNSSIKLLTIARLAEVKGIDLAAEACAKVLKEGYDITWYVIGGGVQKEYIERLIKGLAIYDNFILLGERINPYVYIKDCSIYVQPSRVEGKSISIDEAKMFHKPMVVTDFPTVGGQVKHKINGYVVNIDADSIADGIIHLIKDRQLRDKLVSNLEKEEVGNEQELNVFYRMI